MAKIKLDVAGGSDEAIADLIVDLTQETHDVEGRDTGVRVAGGNPEIEFEGPVTELFKLLTRYEGVDAMSRARLADFVDRIEGGEVKWVQRFSPLPGVRNTV